MVCFIFTCTHLHYAELPPGVDCLDESSIPPLRNVSDIKSHDVSSPSQISDPSGYESNMTLVSLLLIFDFVGISNDLQSEA